MSKRERDHPPRSQGQEFQRERKKKLLKRERNRVVQLTREFVHTHQEDMS